MNSILDINSHNTMTAEEILDEIRFPIKNLEQTLSVLTKLSIQHEITSEELKALLKTLHHQVVQIAKAI
jgi:hypothetical protein